MTEARSHGYDVDVLILGASFLGVELVRTLRRSRRGRALSVAVVDRQRMHPYIPLGHELLTDRMQMSVAADTILETAAFVEARPPSRFIAGEVVGLSPQTHSVELGDGRQISGRFVVVALGSRVDPPPALPGHARLVSYKLADGFARCEAALDRVLGAAAQTGERPELVVIGGGITGVEIAGELAHLATRCPPRWRPPKVTLVHAGERLLPGLSPRAGRKAQAALESQGARVELGTRLLRVDEGEVTVRGDDDTPRRLACALGFWAGGVRPPPVIAALNLPLTDASWLRVSPTLQCRSASPSQSEIFAGGDIARVYGGNGEWPTMQRAIESIFAAHTIAANILTLARCPPRYPEGLPPLAPHRLWTDFPHGVSIGGTSLFVYGRLVLALARLNTWFRRFLMRQYMARYRP